MDLKIFKKSNKKEIGILYLHDEFSKLIKGQVINDKTKESIIKGIEKKWIIGGGAGPGHPSKGFFSDNGGEFLNDEFAETHFSMFIVQYEDAQLTKILNFHSVVTTRSFLHFQFNLTKFNDSIS